MRGAPAGTSLLDTAEAIHPDAASAPDARVGEILADRYKIVARLGEGAMGVVYVAEHTLMRKRVALKLLHAEMASKADVVARFRREAEAVAALDHPHVAAATDFGQTADGSFFLVLEYVDGVALREALRGGPMPTARALAIARQIALGLERAHSAGIVHRDLKPENVMLVRKDDDPDFVKVLDFGIARFDANHERGGDAQALTRIGTLMGTLEYMAPEQAMGQPVTGRADLYSLGIVLYEMLTGQRPFEGDATALLSLHMVAPPPPMAERAPGVAVPRDVEALVLRLLEKDEQKRPASGGEVVAAIDAIARASIAGEAVAHTLAAVPSPVVESAPSPPFVRKALAHLSAFAERPAVRSLVETTRRRASELVASVQSRTKLSRTVVIALLAGVVAVFVGAAITLVGTLVFSSAKPVASTIASTQPPSPPPLAAAAQASAEQIHAAAAKGPASLEALAQQYPRDVAVLRELAFAYDAQDRPSEGLGVIERMAKIDPAAVSPELVRFIARATERSESADQAFHLLEDSLGAQGVDALVEIAERRDLPEQARSRAAMSLKKEEVVARATPATRFLLELDGATTCEARRRALARFGSDADARALGRLRALKNVRGCGRRGRHDCNPCLRSDDVLERAMRAAENRNGW